MISRKQCKVCPQTNACRDWYGPQDIRFCRPQMIWLIVNFPTLHEGRWPPDPTSTYVDLGLKRKLKAGGYFERTLEIAAEVERRLEACRTDGLAVEGFYSWGKTEESLARYFRTTPAHIRERITSVLGFIQGWNFRARPYRRWQQTR